MATEARKATQQRHQIVSVMSLKQLTPIRQLLPPEALKQLSPLRQNTQPILLR